MECWHPGICLFHLAWFSCHCNSICGSASLLSGEWIRLQHAGRAGLCNPCAWTGCVAPACHLPCAARRTAGESGPCHLSAWCGYGMRGGASGHGQDGRGTLQTWRVASGIFPLAQFKRGTRRRDYCRGRRTCGIARWPGQPTLPRRSNIPPASLYPRYSRYPRLMHGQGGACGGCRQSTGGHSGSLITITRGGSPAMKMLAPWNFAGLGSAKRIRRSSASHRSK